MGWGANTTIGQNVIRDNKGTGIVTTNPSSQNTSVIDTSNINFNNKDQIMQIQKALGIEADGIFGPQTEAAYRDYINKRKSSLNQDQYTYGDKDTFGHGTNQGFDPNTMLNDDGSINTDAYNQLGISKYLPIPGSNNVPAINGDDINQSDGGYDTSLNIDSNQLNTLTSDGTSDSVNVPSFLGSGTATIDSATGDSTKVDDTNFVNLDSMDSDPLNPIQGPLNQSGDSLDGDLLDTDQIDTQTPDGTQLSRAELRAKKRAEKGQYVWNPEYRKKYAPGVSLWSKFGKGA